MDNSTKVLTGFSPFRTRNSTLFQVIDSLRDQFDSLKGTWLELELGSKGISYANFSSYMTGRTEAPGALLALLLGKVGWGWTDQLHVNQRILLAETILNDSETLLFARIKTIRFYLAVFRLIHDTKGHRMLVESLEQRFPQAMFPLEFTALRYENCLMLDASRHFDVTSLEPKDRVLNRWQEVRRLLLCAEGQGFYEVELHLGVMRDKASGLSSLFERGQSGDSPLAVALMEAVNDLAKCEEILPSHPAMKCFHWAAFVDVASVIGDYKFAERGLGKLRAACLSVGGMEEECSRYLWLRYDLASASIAENRGDTKLQRIHLERACSKLKLMDDHTWELQIRRYLSSQADPIEIVSEVSSTIT